MPFGVTSPFRDVAGTAWALRQQLDLISPTSQITKLRLQSDSQNWGLLRHHVFHAGSTCNLC